MGSQIANVRARSAAADGSARLRSLPGDAAASLPLRLGGARVNLLQKPDDLLHTPALVRVGGLLGLRSDLFGTEARQPAQRPRDVDRGARREVGPELVIVARRSPGGRGRPEVQV